MNGNRSFIHRPKRGFTLIELLVVLAIIATLLTLVSPNYFRHLDKAKETVLKTNLVQTRDAIDKYYGDKLYYPASLQVLVTDHYLKDLPYDPVLESNTGWVVINPPEGQSGVYDLKSGAKGTASDGSQFQDW